MKIFPEWPKRGSVKQPQDESEDVDPLTEETPPSDPDSDPEAEIPGEIKEEISSLARAAENDDTKVDYSGAQLWKVSTEKTGVRATLGRLRRRNRKFYYNLLHY